MPSGHAAQSSTAWTYLRWWSLRESHGPWRETTRVRSTVPTSHLVISRKSKQLPLSHDIHDPCSPRGRSLRKWVGADEKKLTSAIVCPEKSWQFPNNRKLWFVRKGSKNIMMTSIKQMVHNSLVIQLNKVSVTDVDGLGMFHVPWIPGAPVVPKEFATGIDPSHQLSRSTRLTRWLPHFCWLNIHLIPFLYVTLPQIKRQQLSMKTNCCRSQASPAENQAPALLVTPGQV